jgi:hypothetical protein
VVVHMHFLAVKWQSGEGEMNEELVVHTAACSDYQRLLEECQSALVAWKKRSEDIMEMGLQGKDAGNGLQRLQAEYARTYNRLERHANSCAACRFRSTLGKEERAELLSSFTRKEFSA